MLALGEYEGGVHDCGFHWSLLNDPENIFRPEWKTCPVCRGKERFVRVQNAADKGWRDQHGDNPHAPDPSDGRFIEWRMLPRSEADALRAGQSSQSRGSRPS